MAAKIAKGDGKMELYEYGRRKLGYGDWWSGMDMPYFRYAGMESHKLYLGMRKRRISPDDFRLVVDYAQAHHLRIENPAWLFRFVPDARAWRNEIASQAPSEIAQLIDEAVRYERTLADEMSQGWITRLTRARGEYRQEVLDEWNKARVPSIRLSV